MCSIRRYRGFAGKAKPLAYHRFISVLDGSEKVLIGFLLRQKRTSSAFSGMIPGAAGEGGEEGRG
jgi:hypothetical protein